jgi:ATP-binding cassette subfamily C protein CydCD
LNLDRRLLALFQPHRVLLVLAVLAGLIGGLLIVFQARTLSSIINSVFLFQSLLADISYLLILLLVLILLRGLTIWGGGIAAHHLAVKIKEDLREQLYEHIVNLGPGYLKTIDESGNARSGELVQILNQGIEALEAYYSQYLPQLALAVITPLTILIFVLPVDTLSGLVLIITAPLIPLFMILIGDRADALTKKQWSALTWMSAHFLDVLQGLSTLKVLGRSKDQIDIIARIGERYRQTTMGVLRVTFLSALVLEWIAMLSTAVVAVEISLRLLYGRLAFEQAFFVLLLTPEFYLPLRLLGARFHAGMAGVAAAASIFELLEIQPAGPKVKVGNSHSPQVGFRKSLDPVSVEFNHLHFSYFEDQEVLHDISLILPPGKMTALVGPSGAGKSTIADLLMGFVFPQEGDVLINNLPIRSIPESEYLSLLSWVPQNPYLFNTSIAENIRLSDPDASLEEITAAANNAYAHEFIKQLPEGYDTQIGERGIKLSTGQVQRIALARAFLKQSPLLILDETTANLDPDTENKITSAMYALMEGRTSLAIAHRLSTIQNADQIIVLEQGRIVERGTHHQLLTLRGSYWRMVDEGTSEAIPLKTISYQVPTPGIANSQKLVPPEPANNPVSFSSLRSLLQQLADNKWLVLLSVLLGWAMIISGIGLLATAAYLISAAAIYSSIALLQVPIVGVRFFGLVRGIFRYLERNISHNTTFHLVARLRVWFYQNLEPLAPARLMGYRSGDLLNRIHHDINSLEDFYVRVVAPPLVWFGVTATASILLGLVSIHLGLVLICFQILAGLVTPLVVRYASRHPERHLLRQQGILSAELVDGIQGMTELKVFAAADSQQSSIKRINRSITKIQYQIGRLSSLEAAAESVLAHLASWAILLVAIPLVSSGQIESIYLGALVLGALASFEAAIPLPQSARFFEKGLAAAGRLDDVLRVQPEITDPLSPQPAPARFDLEIRDLYFTYPTTGENQQSSPALKGINLKLEAGHHYAMVGPSGAGKTTLSNILLRFWDYHAGHITLGGHDLSAYDQGDIRALIGLLSQRPHLFNATFRENLILAHPDASNEEIKRVCQIAQIDDFIQMLPRKYDTRLGEGGLRLSAGERQRVALARVLLENTPFVIFDEPTAYLDPITEADLMKAVFSELNHKTTLWITHRLVGMEQMDEIFVMTKGEITERGTHPDLLREAGIYQRMWNLQKQIL